MWEVPIDFPVQLFQLGPVTQLALDALASHVEQRTKALKAVKTMRVFDTLVFDYETTTGAMRPADIDKWMASEDARLSRAHVKILDAMRAAVTHEGVGVAVAPIDVRLYDEGHIDVGHAMVLVASRGTSGKSTSRAQAGRTTFRVLDGNGYVPEFHGDDILPLLRRALEHAPADVVMDKTATSVNVGDTPATKALLLQLNIRKKDDIAGYCAFLAWILTVDAVFMHGHLPDGHQTRLFDRICGVSPSPTDVRANDAKAATLIAYALACALQVARLMYEHHPDHPLFNPVPLERLRDAWFQRHPEVLRSTFHSSIDLRHLESVWIPSRAFSQT
jgi:hypothetical protein